MLEEQIELASVLAPEDTLRPHDQHACTGLRYRDSVQIVLLAPVGVQLDEQQGVAETAAKGLEELRVAEGGVQVVGGLLLPLAVVVVVVVGVEGAVQQHLLLQILPYNFLLVDVCMSIWHRY